MLLRRCSLLSLRRENFKYKFYFVYLIKMGLFSKKKSDSLDTFLGKVEAHPDVRKRVAERLRELELPDVASLGSRTFQFYEREVGIEGARVIADTLKQLYKTEIKDLRAVATVPGDPEPIDRGYSVPKF